jgi:excisionase family DNA binding protein
MDSYGFKCLLASALSCYGSGKTRSLRMEPNVLRVKEVADRLNVHPATVYRWIADGRLPAVRYGKPVDPGQPLEGAGGSIRIPEEALTTTP